MFYTYTRPRYQVSVYRTIGPLVYKLYLIIWTFTTVIISKVLILLDHPRIIIYVLQTSQSGPISNAK